VHFVRALGLALGWDVDLSGPKLGPLNIHLGPLTLAVIAWPLKWAGVFGAFVLFAGLHALGLWWAARLATLASGRPGAGALAAAVLIGSTYWDVTATTLAHGRLAAPLFAGGLLAAVHAAAHGGWWRAVVVLVAVILPQTHAVGLAFLPVALAALLGARLPPRLVALAGMALTAIGVLALPWTFLWDMLGAGSAGRLVANGVAVAGLVAVLLGLAAGVSRVLGDPDDRDDAGVWARGLLWLQVGLGVVTVVVFSRYATKPQYLHPMVMSLVPLGIAGLALPAVAALGTALAATALVLGVQPMVRVAAEPPVRSALAQEAAGRALVGRYHLGPAVAERRVHGALRDRHGGLRYGMLAAAAEAGEEKPLSNRLVIAPAGIELTPLVREPGTIEKVGDLIVHRVRSAVNYDGMEVHSCGPALVPFRAMEWASAEQSRLLNVPARASLCVAGEPDAGLALRVELLAGPAGILSVVVDAPGGALGGTLTYKGGPILGIAGGLPEHWELRMVRFMIPARGRGEIANIRLTGADGAWVVDLF
jgi:hypothetical protein